MAKMKTFLLTVLIMATIYAMPQSQDIFKNYNRIYWESQSINQMDYKRNIYPPDNWNDPYYNMYYFGCASIHVSDRVGLHDSVFYDVQIGDKIGFFDSDGLCCGYNVIETFNNLGISLVGDMPETSFKEGFYDLDSMYLRIWSCSLLQDFECDFISYMDPSEDSTILPDFYFWDGLWHNTGLYVIDTLTKYVEFQRQTIEINQGWGGISSYLRQVNHSLETIFDSIPLVILKNGAYAYMPDEFNTLGNWQNTGYQINVSESCTLEMVGLEIQDKAVELAAGWSLLPVLSTTPVCCNFNINGEYDIIQDMIGGVYWPYQNIFTLEYLIPGKAYMVHLDSPFTFDFEQEYFTGIKEFKKKESKKAIFHKGKIIINGFDLNGKMR